MSIKSPAAAAAVLQLQLHQHPCESIQNVKLPLCTKFGNDECIISQIIHYAAFSSFIFEKSTAAAAAVLQLQQQNLFESIQKIKLLMCTSRFSEKNKLISSIIQIVAAAAAAVLQLQGCSCSSSILLDQFRISNKPCVCSLVIMNALFFKLFNLLLLPALYSQKVLQLQQLQQQYKFF